MTDTNKILERVRKMMAIANDDRAPEAERETAMRMVYNLLAKHNLDMADVPGAVQEGREQQSITISGDTWHRTVCQNIGKLFFCNYFYQSTGVSGKDRHTFIGRQSNVVTAMHMAEYVIKSIRKEAQKRFGSPTSRDGRSFGVGAAATIRHRCHEMLESSITEAATPGTALVLVKLHETEELANDDWMADHGLVVRTVKARASEVSSAYTDGKRHAKSINLSQQIAGGSTPKRTAIK